MEQQTFQGAVVGVTTKPYDFVNRQTGERVKGVSYGLWLSLAVDQAPVFIKMRNAEDAVNIEGAGFGTVLSVTCDLRAKNGKGGLPEIERSLVTYDEPASNGRKARTAA